MVLVSQIINTKTANKTNKMNITQLFLTQFAALISFATASGVLLHDTNLDKAFATVVNHVQADSSNDTAQQSKIRPGSNPHTHAEHMQVSGERTNNPTNLPKNRDRKRQAIKRQALGYHGENFCMPLAGEWV